MQMISSVTTLTLAGNKHIDADTQARAVFNRMAIDFAQMLRRPDVDYSLKQADTTKYKGHGGGHGTSNGKKGDDQSDQMAFFTQVPGYYPSTGSPSPVSLVAYRVSADKNRPAVFNKLERMGKGLLWNGVSTSKTPLVFLPLTISTNWTAATINDGTPSSRDPDGDYETIGPQVFRFEYYYLLKNGRLAETPWDIDAGHTSINGLADVEAIAVAIAIVDPKSRTLLTDQNLVDLAAQMNDFKTQNGNGPVKSGVMETQWNSVVTSNVSSGAIPRAAASAIRVYTRYFNLNLL